MQQKQAAAVAAAGTGIGLAGGSFPAASTATFSPAGSPAYMAPEIRFALLWTCELPTRPRARLSLGLRRREREGPAAACAGVERYGTVGPLRSVAVGSAIQGSGLGGRLVHDRIAHARAHGLASLWLLTTTAPGFFERFGFTPVPRADAPPALALLSSLAVPGLVFGLVTTGTHTRAA